MFCKNCGSKIGNAKKCPNCGYDERKDASLNSNFSEEKILITVEETKKIEFIKAGLYALILLLGLLLLFMPIFKVSIESLDDLFNMDAESFENVLESGGKTSFSYYDEAKLVFEQIFQEESSVNLYDLFISPLVVLLGLIVGFVAGVGIGTYGLIKSIRSILNIDRTRISYFMRTEKYPKEAMAQFPEVWYFVFAIGFVACDAWSSFGHTVVNRRLAPTEILDFSNLSSSFLVIVIMVVGIVAAKIYGNKFDETVRQNIGKRRKQRKEQNRKENEEAHQRNLERKKAQEAQTVQETQEAEN